MQLRGFRLLVVQAFVCKMNAFKIPLSATSASYRLASPLQSLEDVCKETVLAQPKVLIIPKSRLAEEFSSWQGEVVTLKGASLNGSTILPFVNRVPTIIRMTRELTNNLKSAAEYKRRPDVARSQQLVGCGALYGAGKTRISPVLHQCLQRVEPNQKVVFCRVHTIGSPFEMWKDVVVTAPGMEGIATKISKDMSWASLMKVTADHIAENNILLFLHIDDFVPFDETGKLQNTKDNFHACWERMLMRILLTPGMILYISGRLPYFDSAGSIQAGGCLLSVQLDLFSADTIHDALGRISIPTVPGVSHSQRDLALLLRPPCRKRWTRCCRCRGQWWGRGQRGKSRGACTS